MLIFTAVRNMFRNPRRTLAVVSTVAFGTGSLFIFHGFNTGIMNQYRDVTVHSRYGHGQIMTKGYRDQVFVKPWEHWIDYEQEVGKRLKTVPGVEYVFPRLGFFSLLTNGNTTVSGVGQGISGPDEEKFFNTLNIIEGKNLSTEEDGILLGNGLARALNVHPGDRVTSLVTTVYGSMNGVDLTVVGVFHSGVKEFDDTYFRIPLAQAQTLMDTTKVEAIAVGLRDNNDWDEVAKMVDKEMPELEAISFAVLDKVYYQNSSDWLKAQFGVIQIILMTIVILGIFNTVSTNILERKQELGNLRANGESIGDVMRLLITEGAAVGILGSVLGVLIGLFIVHVVIPGGVPMPPAPGNTRQFNVLIELEWDKAIKTFVMGTSCALVGTFFAGWKTARMPMGESLRAT